LATPGDLDVRGTARGACPHPHAHGRFLLNVVHSATLARHLSRAGWQHVQPVALTASARSPLGPPHRPKPAQRPRRHRAAPALPLWADRRQVSRQRTDTGEGGFMHPHLSGQLAAHRVKSLRDEADHYRLAKRHRLAARRPRLRVTWFRHALGSVLSPLHRLTGRSHVGVPGRPWPLPTTEPSGRWPDARS
jgi:hypothetical protein